jgi:mannose-6-phosphate isomerase-like protein (cupin superfamily)
MPPSGSGPGLAARPELELVTATAEREFEEWDDEVRGRCRFVTLFSGDSTSTRELTTGLGVLPVDGWLGAHRHTATETYFVLSGSGIVRLEGVDHPVGAGSAVFVPGDTEHGVRNTGDAELRIFYAFAAHAMSDIEYHFSTEE